MSRRLFFGAVVFALAISFFPSGVQAATTCCCRYQDNQNTDDCRYVDVPVNQYCNDVVGVNWVTMDYDYPSCKQSVTSAEGSADLFFQPNVEFPGVFEGRQPVDGNLLGRYMRAFYVYFIWIVGILATVMVMYAGIQWITAAGNSSKIENAKSTMNGAFIGLVLALSSFVILRTINPTLVSFENLSIFKVPSILSSENVQESAKGAPSSDLPNTPTDYSKLSNVTKYDDLIQSISAEKGLDPYMVKAIMMVESRGNPDALSPAGACGLMQLMKANTNNVCLRGEANAEANIRAGVGLLKQLFVTTCPTRARFKSGDYASCVPSETNCTSNWFYVSAAYNGGLGANCSSTSCPGQTWWECIQNGGFNETRLYVQKVKDMEKIVRKWGFGGSEEIPGHIENDCSDGIDNDTDGSVDCADSDCDDDDACLPVQNVANFTATGFAWGMKLTWENPSDPRYTGLVIRRKVDDSTPFSGPTDGQAVADLDVNNEAYDDGNASDPSRTYYYAAYAHDNSDPRRYASGAFASGSLENSNEELVLCQEDFEGNFPTSVPACNWDLQYSGTGDTWDEDACRPSAGQGSAWAGNWHFNRDGFNPCTTSYPHGMTAFMVAGPYDLSDAADASVKFDWWLRSQGNNNDFFHVGYSLNGINFNSENSFEKSGDFGDTWHRDELFSLEPVLGQAQVWIGFGFITDMSTSFNSIPNGAFVDNVRITKVTGSP